MTFHSWIGRFFAQIWPRGASVRPLPFLNTAPRELTGHAGLTASTPVGGTRLRQAGLTIVAFIALLATGFLFTEVQFQLGRSARADSDNLTWVLSQLEVDVLKLQRALRTVQTAGPQTVSAKKRDLDEVRRLYDILYSRVGIITQSHSAEGFAQSASLITPLVGDNGFLRRYEPAIDGLDADLVAQTPQMSQDIDAIAETVRRQVVVALQAVMVASDQRRADLRGALAMFSAACLAILAVLIAMSVVIYLQNRAERRRSEVTRIALHNLQVTIESSLDAVFIADVAGQIIGCNRAAEGLFALTRQGARGLPFSDLIGSPDWTDTAPSDLCAALCAATQADRTQETRLMLTGHSRDGRVFPVELSISEAQAAGGGRMYIAFVRDISEQIEREESLRQARNEALEGQEAKSRFLAIMSHEMRTPLNGLIAASELLQTSTNLDQRQAWLSEIVLSCGWAALDQVNNVLELARLNSDALDSYPEAAFDVNELLVDLVRQSQPQASKRGTTLRYVAQQPGPIFVRGARALFLRVVYNLLGNAVKFTDAGRIEVRLATEPKDGALAITVQVQDTGIGIAEEDLHRIFHNFETLDKSYARMREGTGLGLGIAKLSAEALGGEITVASVLGQGSTFTFALTLPLAEAGGYTPPRPDVDRDTSEIPGLNILVAEDNPINSQLLTEMLRLRGHQVTAVFDGAEALTAAATMRYDLILMDISMPRMDGLDATRQIRQHSASRESPIIGVTAHASPEEMSRFLQAGMNDILLKPITLRALRAIISAHILGGANALDRVAPPKAPPPQRPVPDTATVPDDRLINGPVMDEALEDMGPDFVAKLVNRITAEVSATLTELAALLDRQDMAAAGKLSHRTGGAAAAVGLSGMHAALARFEAAAALGDERACRTALADAWRILPMTLPALRRHDAELASLLV